MTNKMDKLNEAISILRKLKESGDKIDYLYDFIYFNLEVELKDTNLIQRRGRVLRRPKD